MSSTDHENNEPDKRPLELTASSQDFAVTDVNAPLGNAKKIDCYEATTLYRSAAKEEVEKQNQAGERVYAMLGAVCSFYFKPSEPNEPFGPMMISAEGRSAQPSDFRGEPVGILAEQIEHISHLGVRARLADTVWLLDRKQAVAGVAAINSYAGIVQAIIDQTIRSRQEDKLEHSLEIPDYLRRSLQIGKAIGWDKEPVLRVRQLVADIRTDTAQTKEIGSFLRLAGLDLDYCISDPAKIATEAEGLVTDTNLDNIHSLLKCAASAHRNAKNQPDRDRCLLAAAEVLVSIADQHKSSAMLETNWLEQAIAEMRQVPGTKDRILKLKHRLIDVQANIIDEMVTHSYSEDITEIVENAREMVTGKSLFEALKVFACLSHAPAPEILEEQARQAISENSLSSMFASTQYDDHGKPVHRDPSGGVFADEGKAAIQSQIAQAEKIRRSLVATGGIKPMRQTIMLEHSIDERAIAIICQHSPFIPAKRTAIFINGFLHFMQGNMIAALHSLLPQLENSLRHMLRLHGHDVIKINADMTQEDLGLAALLDRLRPELDSIFGPAMTTDIENLCIYRGGPQLCDRVSHGLISQWEPYGEDAIYTCWLIYQLCGTPLLPHWKELEKGYLV